MRAVARLGRIAAAFSSHARANARTMPALALAPPRAAVAVAPRGVAASTRCATTMTCSAARRHLPSPSRRAFASRATASASAEAAAETAAEAPAKTERRKRVLSGVQPTGSIHIGNYFGAIKNWVDLQEEVRASSSSSSSSPHVSPRHQSTHRRRPRHHTFRHVIKSLTNRIPPRHPPDRSPLHQFDAFYCVVDLHAITPGNHDAAALKASTRSSAAIYLAAGLDPEKSNVFVQSHVAAHSELCWLLNCATPIGWLEKMIQARSISHWSPYDRVGVVNAVS